MNNHPYLVIYLNIFYTLGCNIDMRDTILGTFKIQGHFGGRLFSGKRYDCLNGFCLVQGKHSPKDTCRAICGNSKFCKLSTLFLGV